MVYRAYLVRVWQAGAKGPWRASAESTATRRVYHFAHLEELFAFLAEGATAGEDEERA
jgi:hypothetical protein